MDFGFWVGLWYGTPKRNYRWEFRYSYRSHDIIYSSRSQKNVGNYPGPHITYGVCRKALPFPIESLGVSGP